MSCSFTPPLCARGVLSLLGRTLLCLNSGTSSHWCIQCPTLGQQSLTHFRSSFFFSLFFLLHNDQPLTKAHSHGQTSVFIVREQEFQYRDNVSVGKGSISISNQKLRNKETVCSSHTHTHKLATCFRLFLTFSGAQLLVRNCVYLSHADRCTDRR